jgi:hypothetical protein
MYQLQKQLVVLLVFMAEKLFILLQVLVLLLRLQTGQQEM